MTEFKIGDRVFARVRSYPYWPAKVEVLPTKTKKSYKVIFYFTLQAGYISQKDIEPFNDETIEKFKPLCRTKNFFRESLEDALVDEATEGINIRSDEIKILPLYEEPSKKKKHVVPPEPQIVQPNPQSAESNLTQTSTVAANSTTTTKAERLHTDRPGRDCNKRLRSPEKSTSSKQVALEPILMPAPEDLFSLHLDLTKNLHHRKPNHQEALQVMTRMQRYLDWPSLIKTVPGLVENVHKITNYTKDKKVQLKALYLYNQMKWTLFCSREIDFIEKEFPV